MLPTSGPDASGSPSAFWEMRRSGPSPPGPAGRPPTRPAGRPLSAGTLRYLEPAAFARAVAQVEAWLGLARGGTFAKAGESLLPEKNNALAQSEQLVQCLELLLLVLADVARLREGRPVRLEPWRGSVEGLARSALQLRKAMELAMGALRHLGRNPFADTLLREVALALVAG